MPMNDDQMRAVKRWMDEKCPGLKKCPSCGGQDRSTGNIIDTLSVTGEKSPPQWVEFRVPMVQILCSICGYAMLLGAGKIPGLIR